MDSRDYWKKRGQKFEEELENQPSYAKSFMKNQEKFVMKLLRRYKWKNILEIGCGSGRITRHLVTLPGIHKFVAIDISKELIDGARKNTSNFSIEFHCTDLESFTTDKKFDLVFSCEVLQHIPIEEVEGIMKKLVSFSDRKIILVESYEPEKVGFSSGGYFYIHNYERILENIGVKRVQIQPIPLPFSLKLINSYAKLRNRTPFGKQVIIEVDV